MKLGALFFDSPNMRDAAWLCLFNQDPIRVSGTNKIPDDHALITNLDTNQHKEAGFFGHSRFYHRDWLPRRMDLLTREFGLKNISPEEESIFISQIFGRLMMWAKYAFNINYPKPFGFVPTLRSAFPPDNTGITPSEVFAATNNAKYYFNTTERPSSAGEMAPLSFFLPRVRHAQEVLSHRLPLSGSPWREYRQADIPKGHDAFIAWLNSRRPMLFQVLIKDTHPIMHPLINPGNNNMRKSQSRRVWRTSDELRMMSPFCTFDVHGAGKSRKPIVQWIYP